MHTPSPSFVLASSLHRIKGAPLTPQSQSESDMYVCDLCNRSFSTQGSLKRHRESVHRQSAGFYVCDLCNRSFSTQDSLKRHQQSVHRQSGGFSCRVCARRFYRKDVLQRHLKTHQTAELPVHSAACPTDGTLDLAPPPPPSPAPPERPVCDLCAKIFASQKTLKRHRQTFHRQSDAFSCRVCDRRFYRREHLKNHHIRKHSDEEYEPPASYRCPVCPKSFHYRGHLKEHLKTH